MCYRRKKKKPNAPKCKKIENGSNFESANSDVTLRYPQEHVYPRINPRASKRGSMLGAIDSHHPFDGLRIV